MDLKEYDFFIKENDLVAGSLHLIHLLKKDWKLEDVHIEVFKNGCTNKLLGIWHKDDKQKQDMILIRVYGLGTEFIIDRKLEIENIQRLYNAGCGAKLHATFKNGLAYEYVNGRTLDTKLCKEDAVYPLVAAQMGKLHSVPVDQSPTPLLWTKLRQFLDLSPIEFAQEEQQERFKQKIPPKQKLEEEISQLEAILSTSGNPVVFCHNDLLLANIIYDSEDSRVSFIDFEYAGPNYMAFDIANHFNEFAGMDTVDYSLCPDDKFQLDWLRCYLCHSRKTDNLAAELTEEVQILHKQVNLFALTSHLFWGLWGLIQAKNSTINFDFLGYAIIRIDEYFKRKSILLE